MKINTIFVAGAGQMGAGIAQTAAEAGYQVQLRDMQTGLVDKGLAVIAKNLERSLEKGRITAADKQEILGRITGTTSWDGLSRADLVIEAVPESMPVKKDIFQLLDAQCAEHTILATNTSSLPVTAIAALTKRPDKVIGMHFFNPVPAMKLVEVICGLATSEATYQAVSQAAQSMGKTPVRIADYPGFAGNRIVIPMINEAIFALMEGVASAEDIDNVLKLGFNHPMGPLALADLIGLDTVLYIMEVLYEGYRDSKYRPCPLLCKKVQAGQLGRKSGQGFYLYNK